MTHHHYKAAGHAEFDSSSPFRFVRCHVWWGSCQLWIFLLSSCRVKVWPLLLNLCTCPRVMEMCEALSPPVCFAPPPPDPSCKCTNVFSDLSESQASSFTPLVPNRVLSWSGIMCSLSNYLQFFFYGEDRVRTTYGFTLGELITCYPEQPSDLMSLQTVIL